MLHFVIGILLVNIHLLLEYFISLAYHSLLCFSSLLSFLSHIHTQQTSHPLHKNHIRFFTHPFTFWMSWGSFEVRPWRLRSFRFTQSKMWMCEHLMEPIYHIAIMCMSCNHAWHLSYSTFLIFENRKWPPRLLWNHSFTYTYTHIHYTQHIHTYKLAIKLIYNQEKQCKSLETFNPSTYLKTRATSSTYTSKKQYNHVSSPPWHYCLILTLLFISSKNLSTNKEDKLNNFTFSCSNVTTCSIHKFSMLPFKFFLSIILKPTQAANVRFSISHNWIYHLD